jgi:hypothetical protein
MTLDQFFNNLELYYGERYPDAVKLIMTKYLEKKQSDYLDAAFGALVKRVSRLYGRVPGIAELENYAEDDWSNFGEPSKGSVDMAALYKKYGITGTEAAKDRKLRELWAKGEASLD